MLVTAIVFLFLLSVLVLIHELGHFLVAKKFGIKVEEFGWGFPPKLWGKKIGETEYTINALPIGGFVKLYGEDEAGGGRVGSAKVTGKEAKKDLDRAYFSKPAWQRALVVTAGVVMNILLAFVIFYTYLFITGFKTTLPLLFSEPRLTNTNSTVLNDEATDTYISYVVPNSPAAELDMVLPAKVTAINEVNTTTREAVIETINANKGKEVMIIWEEVYTGDTKSGTVVPRVNPPENEGSMGIAFYPFVLLSYDTPNQKLFSGMTFSYDVMTYSFDIIKSLVALSFEEKTAAPVGEAVSGPVGIFVEVGRVLDLPNLTGMILQFLFLAGAMSVSLAFFNILPIPALDGGRLFFILYEMITRRKVNPRFEAIAHAVGFALLMGLILLIIFSDIFKLLR